MPSDTNPIMQSTMAQFSKQYEDLDSSMQSFFLHSVCDSKNKKIIINESSILDLYSSELKAYETTLTLTAQEYQKYKCNPKVLSYDLYGTTEYWFLLLSVNELHSISQFTLNPLKVYRSSVIDVLNRILSLQQEIVDLNASEVEKALIPSS